MVTIILLKSSISLNVYRNAFPRWESPTNSNMCRSYSVTVSATMVKMSRRDIMSKACKGELRNDDGR